MDNTTQTNQLNELQQIAQEAFSSVPNTYANGFINGVGSADMYVVFQLNGKSSLVLNMTPSLAKTLGESLTNMVEVYERQTGQTVPPLA